MKRTIRTEMKVRTRWKSINKGWGFQDLLLATVNLLVIIWLSAMDTDLLNCSKRYRLY